MDFPAIIWLLLIVVALLIVGIYWLMRRQAKQVNLTRPSSPDEKPDWLRTMPPPETVAATKADGEGITLYDYDEGEQVAAPFAEQVEDILYSLMQEEPSLAEVQVDLGTAADGGLEIWVDGASYPDIAAVPNEKLRALIQQAVDKWEAYNA
ncbi:MAG TPA: hypothetical protein PLD25_00825 [Chloroflexota bacterium]|nr:hypothetical protein [Chloroflexota bacterium]HUM71968.1 hypothetical protein [Chloroflexota bacterium]